MKWDKCEDAFFSANEGRREKERERKRKGKEEEGKEKGKGEREREIGSEALAETEKIANAIYRLSRWLNGRASAAFAGVPGSIHGWGVCDFFRFCQSLNFEMHPGLVSSRGSGEHNLWSSHSSDRRP